ncbi:curli assembly protein CsgC [Yokenella regensburgei]|uniref:curli assembly chaperone CsgC n=1 Tax=Yokenella regensburgei TaxID=158877 RepID=UPI003F16AABD
MHTLLLLAALSSQITFNATQQGDLYTIVPQVVLSEDCLCQVQIQAIRQGDGGESRTQQRKTLKLKAGRSTALMTLRMSITPQDNVTITVTVTDGERLHMSQQWSPVNRT